MGGDEPAHTLIAAALSMGKAVVTANKHVIAHHGPELEAIARRTGASLRFEAAVGGGIPILGPLAIDLAGEPDRARPRHRQRHDELHPEPDDRRGEPARLRGRAGRGAAARLRRGRSGRRRRRPRRRQQARHPGPPRLRSLAGPGGDPHPSRRRRRSRRTGHHDGQPGRPGRRPRGRPDHPAARDGVDRRRRHGRRRPSCRPRCRAIRRSAGRPASATGSRSTPCRSAGSASTVRARAVPPRRRPSWATCSRSPARRARPGDRAGRGGDPRAGDTTPPDRARCSTPRAASGTRSMTERTEPARRPRGRGSSSATARSCR